ncbi:MAG: hypothetical protein Q4G58_12430 [bacterium]|nr:hypothetical protein [bacterium]
MLENKRIDEYRRILKMNSQLSRCSELCLSEQGNALNDQTLYHLVMMPTLISFVEWTLNKAQEDGVERLYFLARDGFQMYLIAEQLCKKAGISIECRYLYGSRYAWRVPQYHLDITNAIDKMCLGGINVTFEMVMKRGGLNEQEAKEVAELTGYADVFYKKMSYQQVQQLKSVLLGCEVLIGYIKNHSLKVYESTIGYLRQEGLFDSIQYAVVDSGWVGSLQETLQHLLFSAGKTEEIKGYYFGLYEIPKKMKREQYDAFYFDDRSRISHKVNFSNCLFETVFTALDGMTLYYERKNERYVPVMETKKNPNEKALEKNLGYLEKYLENYEPENHDVSKNRQLVYELLKRFMGNPTLKEVTIFGNYEFSDDVLALSMQKVAASITDQQIRQQRVINKLLVMTGIRKTEIQESAWIEGSIVRGEKRVTYNLIHAKLYKWAVYLRKSLRRRIK